MITTLSLTVSGLLAVLTLSGTLPISVQPQVMILAMYGLTVLTNLFITGMIIMRVWRIHRAIQLLGRHGLLQPVVLTLLESAGIYTIFVVIAAISGLLNPSAFEPFLSVLGPVMGLSYCLAILAVTIQRSNDAHDPYDSHQPVTFKTSHIDSTCFTNSDSANIEFASDRGGSACEKGVQAQVV
ncbi:hypothetical protein ONZ45_g19263 [Pleurotus djamor]|nr:hypothetical protein ONZ45_g19263 [Pleurotus djamor]